MSKLLQDEVRAAFNRATEDGESPDGLMTSVRALVRELKKEGRPPENVIITVKDLCGRKHQAVAADTDSTPGFSQSKRISDLVVSTVIDEYYSGATMTGSRMTAHQPWQGYTLEIGDDRR